MTTAPEQRVRDTTVPKPRDIIWCWHLREPAITEFREGHAFCVNCDGYFDEYWDKEHSLLCNANDPDLLAVNLRRAIENRDEMKQMGHNARKHVESKFSWDSIAIQFAKIYEKAITIRSFL